MLPFASTVAVAQLLGMSARSVYRISERLGIDPLFINRKEFWRDADIVRMRWAKEHPETPGPKRRPRLKPC